MWKLLFRTLRPIRASVRSQANGPTGGRFTSAILAWPYWAAHLSVSKNRCRDVRPCPVAAGSVFSGKVQIEASDQDSRGRFSTAWAGEVTIASGNMASMARMNSDDHTHRSHALPLFRTPGHRSPVVRCPGWRRTVPARRHSWTFPAYSGIASNSAKSAKLSQPGSIVALRVAQP